ncbi:MAG: cobalamin-dependent protein [Nanoarchaeota archaeon]|nr:cobalamin-dependent protein [Nanoarchaeota archaeon]
MAKKFIAVVPPQVTLFGQEARPQPPMGITYALNGVARAGWEPTLIDFCAEYYYNFSEDKKKGIRITGANEEEAAERVSREDPETIGVSVGVSTDHDVTKSLIDRIRKRLPNTPIIIGGSHASLMNCRLLNGYPVERMNVDYIVTGRDLGSGESTIERLLNALDSGESLEKVPGLLFRKDSEVHETPKVLVTEQSLANLGLIRRDLFAQRDGMDVYSKINRSHTGPVDNIPYAVMHTSRGCGAQCTFCHVAAEGYDRTPIGISLENITKELDLLNGEGIQTMSIEDDNFGGFDSERTRLAIKILKEIKRRGFKGIYFPNGLTLKSYQNNDFALPRTLRSLADSGIKVRSSLPFECGNDDTLKNLIGKPHNLSNINAVINEVCGGGYLGHPNIELDAFFMAGIVGYKKGKFTSETRESIEDTFSLARRVAEQGVLVNVWWMKPNPGCPQYSLWRSNFPDKPFYELQFLYPSGIWGTEEEEQKLNDEIRGINLEMVKAGVGSKRPIYPVERD